MKTRYVVFGLLFFSLALSASEGDSSEGDSAENAPAVCHVEPFYHCRSGSGEVTLLFVHGWGGRASFWKNQLDTLARKYSVVTVELPGHGQSLAYAIEPTIRGLSGALGVLLEQLDLHDVILVGHDMGAFVALAATATQAGKERISALVAIESLVDTRVTTKKKRYQKILDKLHENFPEAARQMISDLFSDDADQAIVDWISGTIAATDPGIALALLDDFFQLDLSVELTEFDGQLVILNTRFNPVELRKLLALNPNVSSPDVPWTEHFVFVEQPELFNHELEQVLELLLDKDL